MKHNPIATANAAGVTTAVLFVVCRTAFIVAPIFSMTVARSWFHGIDISLIAAQQLAREGFFLGFVSSSLGGWLVGYIFAKILYYFSKK